MNVWSLARINAFQQIHINPNSYCYIGMIMKLNYLCKGLGKWVIIFHNTRTSGISMQ